MSFVQMGNTIIFLIIDQNSGNGDVLKQHLKKMGYSNFFMAMSDLDGLNFIKTRPVDFIFCRQKLPDMTGTE